MTQGQLRKQWRAYYKGLQKHIDSGAWPRAAYPAMPASIRSLTCGAKTRSGAPCKLTTLYGGARCKFHGGLSTGPTTAAGKAQARENGKLGGRGRVREPKPMETSSLSQGPGDPHEGGVLAVKTDAFKPNPMERIQKLTVLAEKIVMSDGAADLTKPVVSNSAVGDLSAKVQCGDCANLSAGHRCLAPIAKGTFPVMGEWRVCSNHVAFERHAVDD